MPRNPDLSTTLFKRLIPLLITVLYCPSALSEGEKSISIVGNNELPSAQFIIPWKDSASPMLPDRPVDSLINRSLMPVDPEIFRRKIHLYNKAHIKD
ncbi:MAG: hypothetical protein V3V12_09350 [Gammaproteobacteria bacterium]